MESHGENRYSPTAASSFCAAQTTGSCRPGSGSCGTLAKIASQAALTGHLVLATMHTNNAIQAVTRLVEIGVEPFLVAPSIIGVMAQRLVRSICPHCKEAYALPQEDIKRYFE